MRRRARRGRSGERVVRSALEGDTPLRPCRSRIDRSPRRARAVRWRASRSAEIAAMRQIPRLVFFNTCHPTAGEPLIVPNFDRVAFAAGLARALIEIGVECVVVAGWAVDDVAATKFATTFYDRCWAARDSSTPWPQLGLRRMVLAADEYVGGIPVLRQRRLGAAPTSARGVCVVTVATRADRGNCSPPRN